MHEKARIKAKQRGGNGQRKTIGGGYIWQGLGGIYITF